MACVDMCRPSATSAREPKAMPPPISISIIAEQSPITAHALRSFFECPAPRKTCACPSSQCALPAGVTKTSLLEVAVDDIDQFVRRLRPRALRASPGCHEMLPDVVFDNLGQKTADGAPAGREETHDFAACRVAH